jgi:hypothetical protein
MHSIYLVCFVTVCLALTSCASKPIRSTFVETSNGTVLHGEIDPFTGNAWVTLPDGSRLTGKVSGLSESSNNRWARALGNMGDSLAGQKVDRTAGQQNRAGSGMLESPDGKTVMELEVASDSNGVSGKGIGVLNNGSKFRIVW